MSIKSCPGAEIGLCEFCKVSDCDEKQLLERLKMMGIYKVDANEAAEYAKQKLKILNASLKLAKE